MSSRAGAPANRAHHQANATIAKPKEEELTASIAPAPNPRTTHVTSVIIKMSPSADASAIVKNIRFVFFYVQLGVPTIGGAMYETLTTTRRTDASVLSTGRGKSRLLAIECDYAQRCGVVLKRRHWLRKSPRNYANVKWLQHEHFRVHNNGNVTQKTTDGTNTTYVWDYANRLIALGSSGATTTYGYDAFGARVLQTTATTTTLYPSKWFSVASSTGSGAAYATTTEFVFSGDTLVSTMDQQLAGGVATGSPQTLYIHPDHLGSTNVVTNASGTVVTTKDYYPYGSVRVNSGSAPLARGYIGQFEDQSNLSYLNARYYSPSQGQFISQDPSFLAVGDPNKLKQVTGLDDQFHEACVVEQVIEWRNSLFAIGQTRSGMMAGWRRAVELTITDEELERLKVLSRSRTEPASRVSRAQMLLAYRGNPSFCAVGKRVGVHHQTVQRCVERALAYGPLAAIEDRPRPGKEPVITPEAKAWLVSLACDKAKEHGYPHELWTTRLLARHARDHGPIAGHECLAKLVQGTV